MHELVAITVLFLALIVILVGYNMKPSVVQSTPLPTEPIQPQVVPIYFPRPVYPYPRFSYPTRPSFPQRPRSSIFRR